MNKKRRPYERRRRYYVPTTTDAHGTAVRAHLETTSEELHRRVTTRSSFYTSTNGTVSS